MATAIEYSKLENAIAGDWDITGILQGQMGQSIDFYHEISKTALSFKAFELSYSENVQNDWEEVTLPRRVNNSYTWNKVTRGISLSWALPAFDLGEAQQNLEKCSLFVRMMYPQIGEHGEVTSGNPIWYMSVMNWAHSAGSSTGGQGDITATGLPGFPGGFNFSIVNDAGFIEAEPGVLYPKLIKVSMDYKVIQDDKRRFGWDNKTGKWPSETSAFPWSPVTGLASSTLNLGRGVDALVGASDAGELPTSVDGVTGVNDPFGAPGGTMTS